MLLQFVALGLVEQSLLSCWRFAIATATKVRQRKKGKLVLLRYVARSSERLKSHVCKLILKGVASPRQLVRWDLPGIENPRPAIGCRFDDFCQFAAACQLRHLYSSANREKIKFLTHAHFLIYCQALYALSICTIGDMEINVWRKEIWRQKGPIFY